MEGLIAQGLQKWFKHRKVVDNVSLDIHRGEVVGLLGPNGAGKTTSFYMLVGLLATEGGRIFLEGQEITSLPMYQRCRMGVGYLPQESSVFRKLTVEENLLAILETLDLDAAERRQRARELLAELDLTSLAPYPAYTLSGGERRRLGRRRRRRLRLRRGGGLRRVLGLRGHFLQQRVLQQLLLHHFLQLQRGELEQLDGLLQQRRHDDPLALP